MVSFPTGPLIRVRFSYFSIFYINLVFNTISLLIRNFVHFHTVVYFHSCNHRNILQTRGIIPVLMTFMVTLTLSITFVFSTWSLIPYKTQVIGIFYMSNCIYIHIIQKIIHILKEFHL